MTTTIPTPTQQGETLPDRIWVWTEGPREWHDTKTADSDVEYVRAAVAGPRSVVNLQAWTSIDAWLRENPKATATECLAELVRRIEIEAAATSSPTPAESDDMRLAARIRDKLANGNPSSLLAEIAELVAPRKGQSDKCEHGILWSMECLSCGHSDYVAAPPESTRVAGEQED